jgi:hypothetical protein
MKTRTSDQEHGPRLGDHLAPGVAQLGFHHHRPFIGPVVVVPAPVF